MPPTGSPGIGRVHTGGENSDGGTLFRRDGGTLFRHGSVSYEPLGAQGHVARKERGEHTDSLLVSLRRPGRNMGHSSATAQPPTNLWVPRDMSRERKGERTLTGGRRPKSAGGRDRGMHRGRTRFCQIEPKFRACLNQTGSKLSSICQRLLSSVAVRFLPCDHALLACGFHADSDIPRADSTRIPIFR